MKPQSAGEQAVSIGNMDAVLLGGAGGGQRAGRALRPDINIVAGISHHRLLAGGTRGSVDPHQLALGNGEQAEGIVVPHVGFYRKGQLAHIVDGVDVLRFQADGVQLFLIEGYMLIGVFHHPDQPRGLNGVEIVPGSALYLRLQNRHGGSLSLPK